MLKTLKLIALIILVLGLNSIVIFGQMKEEFKTLAKGNHSKVDKPFVFIARDESTYLELQNLVGELPDASTIDFKKNAVVAGFAGEKSTGGWTIEIRKNVNKISVDIISPQKGMMVTQQITTPYKVSLITIEENQSLPLELSNHFNKNLLEFNITKSYFSYSGGFAGIKKGFNVEGKVKLMTFGDNLTVLFELNEVGAENKRKLYDVASGKIKENLVNISRINTGTFVEMPHPSFSVMGMYKEKNLNLNFQSLPTIVADGYLGQGSLEAKLVE